VSTNLRARVKYKHDIRMHRREAAELGELANEAIALSTGQGFPLWLNSAAGYSGWAAFKLSAPEPDMVRISQAMEQFRSALAPALEVLCCDLAIDSAGQACRNHHS
jgi:hypothetical protein